MKNKTSRHTHPIAPIYDENSKVLILGSFPSVKSREDNFYYAHKQNRFWKVLATIFGTDVPLEEKQKADFLLFHQIALWDVIRECDIIGSSDSSICNAVVNDISIITERANIDAIFLNGKTAEKLYNKYLYPKTNIKTYVLPSTSPANASYSFDMLLKQWLKIRDFLCTNSD
ncbi:MAG: DNA-deoxyinosine glycosylase [Clostridia bacterium]|nr:DNA-deoxyinosine glycosylase [Clostridia bacterium]